VEYLSKNCGLCNEPVEQHSSWQAGGEYVWHTSCARDGLVKLLNTSNEMSTSTTEQKQSWATAFEYLKTLFDRDGGKPSPPSASNLS